jgi:hypothetical protein
LRDDHHSAGPGADLTVLFDWKSDIERLERQLYDAHHGAAPDPWTLCEAECSLDLVENELSTLISQDHRRPGIVEAIRRHEMWRARLNRVIAALHELEQPASAAANETQVGGIPGFQPDHLARAEQAERRNSRRAKIARRAARALSGAAPFARCPRSCA